MNEMDEDKDWCEFTEEEMRIVNERLKTCTTSFTGLDVAQTCLLLSSLHVVLENLIVERLGDDSAEYEPGFLLDIVDSMSAEISLINGPATGELLH